MVRHLHNVNSKLESVNGLRVHLMDQFQEHVPLQQHFDVGYFEGKQQSKVWLVNYILIVEKCSYSVMV